VIWTAQSTQDIFMQSDGTNSDLAETLAGLTFIDINNPAQSFVETGLPQDLSAIFGFGGSDGFAGVFVQGDLEAAVPCPATLPLFATGLGLMAWFAWRRRTNIGGQ
jgi:hypothetical protein